MGTYLDSPIAFIAGPVGSIRQHNIPVLGHSEAVPFMGADLNALWQNQAYAGSMNATVLSNKRHCCI